MTDPKEGRNQEAKTMLVIIAAIVIEECLHVSDQMIEWVVDTATSYHATPNRELFNTYKVGDFGCVKMGNTASSNIVEI